MVGSTPTVKEPQFQDGWLYWLEQRAHEQGRSTLMRRPAAQPTAPGRELTPAPWNLRSRVHTYGGGVYAVAGHDLVFIHDADRCLWHLNLDPAAPTGERQPQRLTDPAPAEAPRAFADGCIDVQRQRWIGVMEAHGQDQLVAVPLTGGEPVPLHEAADFCGYATLSPAHDQLAWVEWQQPSMPWESSSLWLAAIGADGRLERARQVAGSQPGQKPAVSVFQPLWIRTPAGAAALVVASDASGWWNLHDLQADDTWRALLPMEAEFAMPQWVYGMRITAWDGTRLLAACCRKGSWDLGEVLLGPNLAGAPAIWRPLGLPFNDLTSLCAAGGQLVAVAGNPTTGPGLLQVELDSGHWHHSPASAKPCPLSLEQISQPEALWFEGYGGHPTHAWYYPPSGGAHPDAPLLVKSHSGPTGMARTSLNLGVQFWTSRGWGVVDVNYGGSTGFGRTYRQRLDRQWGVVDVADCAAAALALVNQGRAAAHRLAIEGSSAGGFTTLAALCFTTVFKAGASRYGVADLAALATDTHRFEAHYLDALVGVWPDAQATYIERSPLQHADRLGCPVIFFQGLDDAVVPPDQTDHMAAALEVKGVAVEVHRFAGEGHGFRDGATLIQVLKASEAFFRLHLGL